MMQTILIVLSILIFLLFLLPLFYGVHNFGTAVGVFLGACFFACGYFWEKMNFTMQKYSAFVLFVVVVSLILLCERVKHFGRDTAKNQQVIIVLGCRVKGDVPSVALQKRAESAYFYLLKNPESVAVLSGGQGRDESISEAQCLKNLLVDRGISSKRLFLEERSVSTEQNIRFSKEIIKANGFSTDVAIATSEYHQFRAAMICKKYKLTAYAVSSETQPLLLPTFLLRELPAIINEKLK